jgi:tetratricopeptide (TPR) repeat protein
LPLARDVGDQRGIASCLNNLGLIAKDQREYDAALAYYEDSLAISREIRDQRLLSHTLENLGVLTELQGDYQAAEKYFNDSLSLSRETGEQHAISDVLCNLAFLGLKQHDIAQAQQHLNEALPIAWEIEAHPITLETLVGFAWLRLLDNRPQSAAELLGLVMAHPATSAELIKDRVDPLLINIERTLSSEELKASLQQGKGLELEPVVAGLLAEATQ